MVSAAASLELAGALLGVRQLGPQPVREELSLLGRVLLEC